MMLLLAGLVVLSQPQTLRVGESGQIRLQATDASGVVANPVVSWKSLNPSGLSVSPTGVVTAKKVGTACVRAAWRTYAVTACVTVTNAPVAYALLAPPDDTLGWAATRRYRFVATANGATVADPAVAFTASDTTITVTDADSGRVDVTGVTPGMAYVIATYQGRTDTMAVAVLRNVERVAVVGPNGETGTAVLDIGQTLQLYALLYDVRNQILEISPTPPFTFPYRVVPVAAPLQPRAQRLRIAQAAITAHTLQLVVRAVR